MDPGLFSYSAKRMQVQEQWLTEFKDALDSWANNQSWLAADEPWRDFVIPTLPPAQNTHIWTPDKGDKISEAPSWAKRAPALALAMDLLRSNKPLYAMDWRAFEELIGALLEKEGWRVDVTQPTRDGGVDVVAIKHDVEIGSIQSVWQAKKYGPRNKVQLKEVRELSAIRDYKKATKAVIVTTSHLTKDALEWVRQDRYRLAYKDEDGLVAWLKKYASEML
jgi:hypothetical protein